MKIIKWISILVTGLLLALVLALEVYYFYAARKLDPKQVSSNSKYSQSIYDTAWISAGEKGEIELERISATGFVLSFLSYSFSDIPLEYSEHFSKGSMVSNQVARLQILKMRQSSLDRKISTIVTLIWLSRNSQVHDLLGYLIDESYFGMRLYGLEAASSFYFNKRSDELDINETVGLISLLKAPLGYNPYCNPTRFRKRAKFLYSQLQKNWPNRYSGQEFSLPQVIDRKGRKCKQPGP